MFLRTFTANDVEYGQLVHNEWVEVRIKTRLLYSFGRKSELDIKALERLVQSILRYRDPDLAQEIRERADLETPFEFLKAKTLGGAFVLDAMWDRLGVECALAKSLAGRGFEAPIKRLLFALVAQRALDPGSKLAAERWVAERTFIPGPQAVKVQQLYRAMDYRLEAHDEIQRDVNWRVRNLEGEDPDDEHEAGEEGDAEAERKRRGFRKRSRHSKNSRPDLASRHRLRGHPRRHPREVLGVARQHRRRDRDRGGVARPERVEAQPHRHRFRHRLQQRSHRKTLQGAGDTFIIGETMRVGKNCEPQEALKRPGGYKTLANGVRVKEVIIIKGSVTRPQVRDRAQQ